MLRSVRLRQYTIVHRIWVAYARSHEHEGRGLVSLRGVVAQVIVLPCAQVLSQSDLSSPSIILDLTKFLLCDPGNPRHYLVLRSNIVERLPSVFVKNPACD